jgi:hypothetical protein
MENQEYYSFNPSSQAITRPKIKKDNHLIKGVLFILLALILIGGAFATAYFTKSWPFSSIGAAQLFEQAIEKTKTINSTYYDFSIEVKSANRQADVTPFEFNDPDYQASLILSQQDNTRLTNEKEIFDKLRVYKLSKKKYPKTLVDAGTTVQDPLGQVYQYTSTDQTFALKIVFETDEVVDKLSKQFPGLFNGKEATFKETTFVGLSWIAAAMVQPPQKPLLAIFYDGLSRVASWVPNNFSLIGKISGNMERGASSGSDAVFKIGGNLTLEDLIMNAEIESLKKGQDVYVKINALPGIPGINISDLKQKWIKITPADLTSFSSSYALPIDTSAGQEEILLAQNQLKTILRIAQDEQLIRFKGEPKKEILDKEKVYHYQFELNKEKFATFYSKTANELASQFQNKALFKFDQKIFDELNSTNTLALIDYINKNISIDLYVSIKTGYPIKGSLAITAVPPADSNKTNQITLSFNLALSNINQKINIDVPKEFIGVEDAYLIIQGISREDYQLQKQKQNVADIVYAIDEFRRLAGKYPDFLDQLKLTREEVSKLNATPAKNTILYNSSKPLLVNIPEDVFAKQSFIYSKTVDDNYRLVYQIVLPVYQKGKKISSELYNVYATKPTDLLFLAYVSGLNTRDKTKISLEADAQSKIDSDKDKLSDSFELYIGTNPNDNNTDKDGYLDGEEIKSGYDPLSTNILQ